VLILHQHLGWATTSGGGGEREEGSREEGERRGVAERGCGAGSGRWVEARREVPRGRGTETHQLHKEMWLREQLDMLQCYFCLILRKGNAIEVPLESVLDLHLASLNLFFHFYILELE
jgi:hypothetical protein